jgi:putative methionine-R-sulfoxide reductase with GAF domain
MELAGTVTRWILLVLLPTVAATLSAVAAASKNQQKTNAILGAVFCALLLAAVQVYSEVQAWRANRSRVTAKASLANALNRSGRPLVVLLGRVAESSGEEDRRADVNTLISRTVGIAHSQCGRLTGTRCATRSVFYQFESAGRLVRRDSDGRVGRAPRLDFVERRSASDRAVIEIAEGENSVLVLDVDKAPPDHFSDYRGREYKSFLMVPVRTEERSYGFISVDSDRPNTLTEADVGYVTLMAGVLAAALALLEGDYPLLDNGASNIPKQSGGGVDERVKGGAGDDGA